MATINMPAPEKNFDTADPMLSEEYVVKAMPSLLSSLDMTVVYVTPDCPTARGPKEIRCFGPFGRRLAAWARNSMISRIFPETTGRSPGAQSWSELRIAGI